MVAADFLQDPLVQGWLDGVEPAWTLLTFESLLALRHEPSAIQSAIQIANDLSIDEIAGSAVARNTLILLKHAIERVGLPLTATGNLSRATVAEMCKLIEWPNYDQADAFRLNKVINEPDFLPLHVVRQLAQRQLWRAPAREAGRNAVGKVHPKRCEARELTGCSISSRVLAYGPELLRTRVVRVLAPGGRGVVLWSLSVCANDWQSADKLTRLCTIPEPAMFSETWDRTPYAMEARILRPLLWFGLLEHRSEKLPSSRFGEHHFYRKTELFDRLLAFDVQVDLSEGIRH